MKDKYIIIDVDDTVRETSKKVFSIITTQYPGYRANGMSYPIVFKKQDKEIDYKEIYETCNSMIESTSYPTPLAWKFISELNRLNIKYIFVSAQSNSYLAGNTKKWVLDNLPVDEETPMFFPQSFDDKWESIIELKRKYNIVAVLDDLPFDKKQVDEVKQKLRTVGIKTFKIKSYLSNFKSKVFDYSLNKRLMNKILLLV